jgi:hypothetical protein
LAPRSVSALGITAQVAAIGFMQATKFRDYLTMLEFHRDVAVDTLLVRQACGLEDATPIALVVTVHSPVARFRRVLVCHSLLEEASSSIPVYFEVPSAEVAGHLRLDTEIVLMRRAATRTRFAAHLAGSRLFSETVAIEIEGTASRMPLEVASFARQLTWLNAPRAPWHVDCGSRDLHFPVMHDLRVYLNADAPSFLDGVTRGDRALHALLKAEVAKRMLESAFEDADFLGGIRDFGDGTMGQAAVRILRLCFGDMTPKDVSVIAARDPGKFEAAIRSRFTPDHD